MAAELTILDVGHGNCAVVHDNERAIVIDAGPGTGLLEFLSERGITRVVAVLISHADTDHLKGLDALLAQSDIAVDAVWLNSDASKNLSSGRLLSLSWMLAKDAVSAASG